MNIGRFAWPNAGFRRRAFTLIELLVVLAIIGMLAALTIPKLGNIRKNNAIVSAGRQLVDDIALARAVAIGERTTVHMVFVPPEILSPFTFSTLPGTDGDRDRKMGERLKTGPYTSYALFADRTVGDQPGRRNSRYFRSWKSLPDGIFIATNKFLDDQVLWTTSADLDRPFEYTDKVPFPTVYKRNVDPRPRVPHVAFDSQGRLVDESGKVRTQDEYIPLSRGSILYSRDTAGNLVEFDLRESPPGNWSNNFHRVRIDGLTGRARVETPQITP